MNLFKNQIPLQTFLHELSYKEALELREVRIKRMEAEYKNGNFDIQSELEEQM